MQIKTVYISGPITHNPDYIVDFKRAEDTLKKTNVLPINPVSFSRPGFSWDYYMRKDIRLLMGADVILMLRGWWRSKGARLERKIAKAIGIKVIYESPLPGLLYRVINRI